MVQKGYATVVGRIIFGSSLVYWPIDHNMEEYCLVRRICLKRVLNIDINKGSSSLYTSSVTPSMPGALFNFIVLTARTISSSILSSSSSAT